MCSARRWDYKNEPGIAKALCDPGREPVSECFSLNGREMKRLPIVALLAVMSCARGVAVSVPQPGDARPGTKPPRLGASFPGFDKRDFPGLRDMRVWYATSPYEWVGYYLPSPCYSGMTWAGNRGALIDQGWGLAVIYVGLQAPKAASVTPDTSASAAPPTRCSQNTLSTSQGRIDADDAVDVAAADGFPEGATIFLDVERADPYPAELDTYVRAWVARVLARKFTPGIYAHRTNAQSLFDSQKAVYAAAGDARQPPFWVANSTGFDLAKSPADSGFPFASVWQNPSDSSETYGGVKFRIDQNVSSTRSPSG
jgi:hypothetical protein